MICLSVYGWKRVLESLTSAADNARGSAHFLEDMLFFVLLVVVGVCLFPGMTMIELTCGFVFGFKEGFVVNYLGTVVAAMVSFMLGRFYLREKISAYLDSGDSVTFGRFLRAIERKNGVVLLSLFRLMLVPFFVKNYGPSVINTSLVHYTIAVLITTPVFVGLLTFIGSEAKSIADVAAGGSHVTITWFEIVPVVVSVLAGCVLTWLALVEFRRQELMDEEKDEDSVKHVLVPPAVELGKVVN